MAAACKQRHRRRRQWVVVVTVTGGFLFGSASCHGYGYPTTWSITKSMHYFSHDAQTFSHTTFFTRPHR